MSNSKNEKFPPKPQPNISSVKEPDRPANHPDLGNKQAKRKIEPDASFKAVKRFNHNSKPVPEVLPKLTLLDTNSGEAKTKHVHLHPPNGSADAVNNKRKRRQNKKKRRDAAKASNTSNAKNSRVEGRQSTVSEEALMIRDDEHADIQPCELDDTVCEAIEETASLKEDGELPEGHACAAVKVGTDAESKVKLLEHEIASIKAAAKDVVQHGDMLTAEHHGLLGNAIQILKTRLEE